MLNGPADEERFAVRPTKKNEKGGKERELKK